MGVARHGYRGGWYPSDVAVFGILKHEDALGRGDALVGDDGLREYFVWFVFGHCIGGV